MKHKLLTLASAAVLLAACSDSSVSDANDEIKDKATVTFMVVDANTMLPLQDVSVYYRPTDKTKYTDSTGTSIWKDVEIGDGIYWDFQYENYAMKRFNYTITDGILNDVARVHDLHPKVVMYELGVDVKGQLFYVDAETGNWKPAKNVDVYAKYEDSEIYPNEVHGKTDSLGNYSFKKLASNAKIYIKTERFIVDSTKVYEVTTIDSVSERKGVLKELNPVAAQLAALEPVLLSSNLSNVDVKGELKLSFSEVLEKDSVTTEYIKVKRVGAKPAPDANGKPTNVTDVSVTVSLSDDGKTVIVKSASGTWADGKQYIVEFDVWSKLAMGLKDTVEIGGIKYTKYRKFTAGKLAVPGQVKNLMIDLNDDDAKTEKIDYDFTGTYTFESEKKQKSDLAYNEVISLKWDGIEKNVDSYNVYVKADIDGFADYVFVDNYTDTTAQLDLAIIFNDTNYLAIPASKKQPQVVNVLVLPVNAAGEALASGAKSYEIKTFEKVQKKVKEMQENKYLVSASITKASTFFYCGTEEASSCNDPTDPYNAITAASDLVDDKYYTANLVVAGKRLDEYEGVKPSGYDLYYNKGNSEKPDWVKIDSQDGAESYTFSVPSGTKDTPFENPVKYKKTTSKVFKFAVVPFFDFGYCDDGLSTNAYDCVVIAGSNWTSVAKVSQVNLSSGAGVFTTSTELQEDIIDKL